MISRQCRGPARPGIARFRRLGLLGGCLLLALQGTLLVQAASRSLVSVYRPSTGEWFVRSDDGSATRIQFGSASKSKRSSS